MGNFAVIDTETNWADQVMSIGTVIADTESFAPIAAKYHILPIECQIGGMYESHCSSKHRCLRSSAPEVKPLPTFVPGFSSMALFPSSLTMPALTATTCRSCGTMTGMISCVWQPTASITQKSLPMPTAALPAG